MLCSLSGAGVMWGWAPSCKSTACRLALCSTRRKCCIPNVMTSYSDTLAPPGMSPNPSTKEKRVPGNHTQVRWNMLPIEIRALQDLIEFLRACKTELVHQAFGWGTGYHIISTGVGSPRFISFLVYFVFMLGLSCSEPTMWLKWGRNCSILAGEVDWICSHIQNSSWQEATMPGRSSQAFPLTT